LIVKEVWELIARGKLKPGDKLPPERELVKKFRISKVPLREALQTLEAYGFIAKKRGARGGSIILDVAPTQGVTLLANYLQTNRYSLEELVQARQLIEPRIARLAAERISPQQKAELQRNLEQHAKELGTGASSQSVWEFYLILARISGNSILRVIEELLIRLVLDTEFSFSIIDPPKTREEKQYAKAVLLAQRRIAAAVMKGNPVQAEAEMLKFRRQWGSIMRGFQKRATSGGKPR